MIAIFCKVRLRDIEYFAMKGCVIIAIWALLARFLLRQKCNHCGTQSTVKFRNDILLLRFTRVVPKQTFLHERLGELCDWFTGKVPELQS